MSESPDHRPGPYRREPTLSGCFFLVIGAFIAVTALVYAWFGLMGAIWFVVIIVALSILQTRL